MKRVVIHKDYKAPTFENDLAILELEEPIERQPHVVPICMPRDDAGDFLGHVGIVSGWGRLEYGGSVPNILHQAADSVMTLALKFIPDIEPCLLYWRKIRNRQG